jgi:hypothetical protein
MCNVIRINICLLSSHPAYLVRSRRRVSHGKRGGNKSGDEIQNSIERSSILKGVVTATRNSGHFFNYPMNNEEEIKSGFIHSFCVTLMACNKVSSDVSQPRG